MRDPRFALAYVALIAAGLRAILPNRPRLDPRVLGLWLFFAVSYLGWLIGFSILRYAMPLEVLSGVVMVTSLRYIVPAPLSPRVFALALVGCIVATRPISWGRIGYDQDLVEAPAPTLPPDAVVFMVGAPIGFVVPYLAAQGNISSDPIFWPRPRRRKRSSADWSATGRAETCSCSPICRRTPPGPPPSWPLSI